MKHLLTYAYPTSDLAERAGKHGYVVEIGNHVTAFDKYEDALFWVKTLNTEPDRWSIDHPENEALLKKSFLAYAYHAPTHEVTL